MEFQTGVIRPVECFQEGWELIKDRYWLFLGITLVGMLIAGLIPFGIGLGAMFCGIYYCLLKKYNNHAVEFGDLFKGFDYFVPGLIVSLILMIPAFISVFFVYGSIIAIFLASMGPGRQMNESAIWTIFGTIMIEGIIISLVMGCVHALLMFAYPLIVERKMNGWAAFKLSARAVWANLSGVIGLILCEFVLGIIGYLLLVIGVYFVMPIMFAGVLVAYRKVFPSDDKFSNMPPQPPTFVNNSQWQ